MASVCPVPTPEQRRAAEILAVAERAMMEAVQAAVAEAAAQVRDQLVAGEIDLPPASKGYFEAVVHQQMFLTLCGANTETLEGGDTETTIRVIRNQQQIANRYWGADIAVTPKVP